MAYFTEFKICFYKFLIAYHHLINGLYSGFPLCCILYFIRHSNEVGTATWVIKCTQKDRVGYVRCPYCIQHRQAIKVIREGGPDWADIDIGWLRTKLLQYVKTFPVNEHYHYNDDWCDNPRVVKYNKRSFCLTCGYKLN